MIPEDEAELHDVLEVHYEDDPGIEEVRTRENLANYNVEEYMEKWFDESGFRSHEIDLLLVRWGYKLEAVEIKYFRPSENNTPDNPFYSGISQAVALTRSGVDYVSLHHYFHPEINSVDVNEYGSIVKNLKLWLDLPFEYGCYQLDDDEEFNPSQIAPQRGDKQSITETTKGINTSPGKSNPLLEHSVAKSDVEDARDFLKRALRIPGE